MEETLYKAFDIIIENQRNADTKSNIFIAIIGGVLTVVGTTPIRNFEESITSTITFIFLLIFIPLLAFIISLIPIYSSKFTIRSKRKQKIKLNIFYWASITQYSGVEEFIGAYKETYLKEELTIEDLDILQQIYTNAMILDHKKRWHKVAFFGLFQLVLLMLCAIIYIVLLEKYIFIPLILLGVSEIVFFSFYFNIGKLFKKIKKCCKRK